MTSTGLAVDEVIPCPGLGSGDAMSRVVQIVTADGSYRAVQVAPDRLQFARTFRPTWAIVAGCLGLLFFFVGVLFFFVKTTETAVASVETDHRGTRLRLSGRIDRSVLGRIRQEFADPDAAETDAARMRAVGSPVPSIDAAPPSTPTGQPVVRPAFAPVHTAAPANPPVPVPVPAAPATAAPAPTGADTIVGYRPPAVVPTPAPRVVFDDGSELRVTSMVLLGRDPAAGPEDDAVTLIPISDPSRSISKTHLAIAERDGVVWVMDRHSTNGTTMIGSDGTEAALVAGKGTPVPVGSSVRLGSRSFRVASPEVAS